MFGFNKYGFLVCLAPDGAGGGDSGGNNDDGKGSKEVTPEIQAKIDEAIKKSAEERDKFWASKFDQKNTEAQRLKAEAEKPTALGGFSF